MPRPLPRLPDAILLLYPRAVRQRHGQELASLAEDLVRHEGRSRSAVLGRLAVDGLTQRLTSTATAWTVTVALALTSFTGLALCDFAAASAHPRPHRVAHAQTHVAANKPVAADAQVGANAHVDHAHARARVHRHHRIVRGRAGIIAR